MKGQQVFAIVGLCSLALTAGYGFLSCSDDDDASLDDGEAEDNDLDPPPDDDNDVPDDDTHIDDDTSPSVEDDDLLDDDSADDDTLDDDTTPDDDSPPGDDDDNTPDPECLAAYERYYECYPEGLGGYTMEEFILDHCYGSPDEVYGPDGGLVQCYLTDPECRAFGICVAHLTATPDADCIAAYERYYECNPGGFIIYTLEEMIWDNCWGGMDPKYGVDGYVVQCYLQHPDDCIAYTACVDETLLFHYLVPQPKATGPQCLVVLAADRSHSRFLYRVSLRQDGGKR